MLLVLLDYYLPFPAPAAAATAMPQPDWHVGLASQSTHPVPWLELVPVP